MAKTRFGTVLEYFRSLQKKRRIGKVRKEKKLEVKGKRVSSRVIRQVSENKQLKIVAERWVFLPPFGHVTRSRDRACWSCSHYENPVHFRKKIFVNFRIDFIVKLSKLSFLRLLPARAFCLFRPHVFYNFRLPTG